MRPVLVPESSPNGISSPRKCLPRHSNSPFPSKLKCLTRLSPSKMVQPLQCLSNMSPVPSLLPVPTNMSVLLASLIPYTELTCWIARWILLAASPVSALLRPPCQLSLRLKWRVSANQEGNRSLGLGLVIYSWECWNAQMCLLR